VTEKTELQKHIDENWSEYCDLDYWISEMTRGSETAHISKHVIKMAMKHLRDNLYDTHHFLCLLEEEKKMGLADRDLGEDFLETVKKYGPGVTPVVVTPGMYRPDGEPIKTGTEGRDGN
jgi:hypothetical protein